MGVQAESAGGITLKERKANLNGMGQKVKVTKYNLPLCYAYGIVC